MEQNKNILVTIPLEPGQGELLRAAARTAPSGSPRPRWGRRPSGAPPRGAPDQELADWADICLGICRRNFSTARRSCCGCRPTPPGWRSMSGPGCWREIPSSPTPPAPMAWPFRSICWGCCWSCSKSWSSTGTPKSRGPGSPGQRGSVYGATVLVLGMGDIGGEFGQRCKALGARVIGVRRSKRPCPDYADEVHTLEDLDELLPQADVVAVTLPGDRGHPGAAGPGAHRTDERRAVLLTWAGGISWTRKPCVTPWRAGSWPGPGWTLPTRAPARGPPAVAHPHRGGDAPCVRVLPSEGDPPAHREYHGGEPEAFFAGSP